MPTAPRAPAFQAPSSALTCRAADLAFLAVPLFLRTLSIFQPLFQESFRFPRHLPDHLTLQSIQTSSAALRQNEKSLAMDQLTNQEPGTTTDSTQPQPSGSNRSSSGGVKKMLLVGDCMLGRLIDQLFPTHNPVPEDHALARYLVARDPSSARQLAEVGPYKYIWGNTLPLFEAADARIVNLETSITSHPVKWPGQAFNFRMHPANVQTLKEARVDFCSLANNHILDYDQQGRRDTCHVLDEAGIRHAGCGENLEEAAAPAFIQMAGIRVACLAAADHFQYWAAGPTHPGIHFIDPDRYTSEDLLRIERQVREAKEKHGAQLAVFSVHWGPNYRWQPSAGIRRLAHDLVDRCGIDVIHGTSPHHAQGIEIYKGVPIIYGCGDFVDDYAVDTDYRNDLSFAYMLHYHADSKRFTHLKLHPTLIRNLSVTTSVSKADRRWLCTVMRTLCSAFGTKVETEGDNEALLIPISP